MKKKSINIFFIFCLAISIALYIKKNTLISSFKNIKAKKIAVNGNESYSNEKLQPFESTRRINKKIESDKIRHIASARSHEYNCTIFRELDVTKDDKELFFRDLEDLKDLIGEKEHFIKMELLKRYSPFNQRNEYITYWVISYHSTCPKREDRKNHDIEMIKRFSKYRPKVEFFEKIN